MTGQNNQEGLYPAQDNNAGLIGGGAVFNDDLNQREDEPEDDDEEGFQFN